MKKGISRRTLFLGSLVGAGSLWLARPSDRGVNHNDYFQSLSQGLHAAKIATPSLVVDKTRLDHNIRTLMANINGRFHYRIVAKSLPSTGLLQYIMTATQSQRLMVFNQPFLNQVAKAFPNADVLMGKPMPVQAAENFYRQLVETNTAFDPSQQLQWLIDTPERLQQYQTLAAALELELKVNIEIDVGLHRGGVDNMQQLQAMLDTIEADPLLRLGGIMGYEPHVAKLPGSSAYWRDQAMQKYQAAVDLLIATLGEARVRELTLNCGGSPTYTLYREGQFPFNELSAGSCLVKPTDFDLATLIDHQPAAFIATPVLKQQDQTRIPGIDLGSVQALWDRNKAQSFFTYGGYWKATPVSPQGLSNNSLFGRSTNQEMLNGSTRIHLKPDDWVFLRPTQSEFVFLQFGDLILVENGQAIDAWPVFSGQTTV